MENLNLLRVASKLEENFGEKIDLLDVKRESAELPNEFFSRSIAALTILMECGIDIETAANSITDGYHDLGIDAVFNDAVQKKLVIVQSKWRNNGTGGITNEEINSFVQGIKRLINLDFAGANAKLLSKEAQIVSALKDMDYQIKVIFCHTGNQAISEYCMRPVIELQNQVNDDVSEILLFSEVKLQDIFTFLANGQGNDNICLDDVILSDWGSVEEPYNAYYGTLPASALGQWYKEYGNRLFAKNIRFYKGSTDVNQGIRNVLRDEPDKFFYYNNGIKILCNKITRKAAYSTNNKTGLFALEGVSLVNGVQTTGTIGNVFLENPEQVQNAKVFVQLIDLNGADESQAIQITRLSNTQNRIDNKDFAALDPQQDRIKTELSFAGINYLYKSGAVIEEPTKQISLDEAIVAQACYQDDISYTAIAKSNIGALTENIDRPPYKLLFNAGTNTFSLINNVWILRAVEKYISQHESSSVGRNRLALVHGNRFILYLAIHNIKDQEIYNKKVIDINCIESQVNGICEDIILNLIDSMNETFPDAYPAHIFKNVGRCRTLLATLKTEGVAF